jgi:hypothetical protein
VALKQLVSHHHNPRGWGLLRPPPSSQHTQTQHRQFLLAPVLGPIQLQQSLLDNAWKLAESLTDASQAHLIRQTAGDKQLLCCCGGSAHAAHSTRGNARQANSRRMVGSSSSSGSSGSSGSRA